ncbi:arrestin (or S-antigen) [Metarhizium acridum CQMa 102]|uniref:Arrestin (Or S-antigen) n=1 Tax=Metarhizium acridum (strain CQMa 102) TaxID=655827 RepID=E9E2M1_METAQ|nr:arrestin (or S-antigen) [Metarhizium acridum CQMa 102]EFY89910.1 arrestin (or S-antigen) [Metarhizium acridum CQMa 102]
MNLESSDVNQYANALNRRGTGDGHPMTTMSAQITETICPESCPHNKIRAEIEINQHYTYKIYTPGSLISGHVTISTPSDVLFHNIDILFVGSAATRNVVQPDPVCATKSFLKLCMPIDEASFPTGHLFKAAKMYTIPFHFVVPAQLLMGSCRHRCQNAAVQERHLRLPPSMGFCPGDDQSPDGARIVYSIIAVGTRHVLEPPIPVRLFAAYKTIRILPISPEDAPLDIAADNRRYVLCKTQCLWKAFFTGREGILTASASQPKAVMLSPDETGASWSLVRLKLVFAPASSLYSPPRIKSVSGKIIATTFFNISPLNRLPSVETWGRSEDQPFQHTTSSRLFDEQAEGLVWTKDADAAELERRRASYPLDPSHTLNRPDEILTRHRTDEDGGARPSMCFTSAMDIQFSIPGDKSIFFPPSFDSCLISRVYTLRLTISLGAAHTNLVLKLPLQIGVQGATPDAFRAGDGGSESQRIRAAACYNVLPEYSSIF